MSKTKILIPILIVGGLLSYCWIIFLNNDSQATWRHYIGSAFFVAIIILYYKDLPYAVIATGIYLLVATFNGLAITPVIQTSWFRVGIFETPPVQLISLGLFIFYFILNTDNLINIYLDYKEAKQIKNSNDIL